MLPSKQSADQGTVYENNGCLRTESITQRRRISKKKRSLRRADSPEARPSVLYESGVTT